MDVRKFVVRGEPKGKGRPKFSRKMGRAYTPPPTASYENLVKLEYQQQNDTFEELKVPVVMEVRAYYGIPVSTSKKKREMMLSEEIVPVKKPDADNVAKIICDALNGLAYCDDACISDLYIRRRYSAKPRVEVTLRDYVWKGASDETKGDARDKRE